LVFQGGAAWRRQLEDDLAIHPDTLAIVRRHDDAALAQLMTNLAARPAGHLEAFDEARPTSPSASSPIHQGLRTAFQGHKDNHSG